MLWVKATDEKRKERKVLGEKATDEKRKGT